MSRHVIATGTIFALAGLDLIGAVIAQRYIQHRSAVMLVMGCVVFAALFLVYARSLGYAGLTTVTFGWIVVVQVGVVLLDHSQRGIGVPADKLAVIVAMLGLQAYLIMAPTAV